LGKNNKRCKLRYLYKFITIIICKKKIQNTFWYQLNSLAYVIFPTTHHQGSAVQAVREPGQSAPVR
jgi:hypothetical protein